MTSSQTSSNLAPRVARSLPEPPSSSGASSPVGALDALLDRVTMYRLLVYVLAGYLVIAFLLASVRALPFPPLALLGSVGFLMIMCWAANVLLSRILAVPTNNESALITALILALILDPASSDAGWQFLGWAALLAIASKFIISVWRKHIFNPAALAVLITALALRDTASWWVGSGVMAPVTIAGGLIMTRKIRQEEMVGAFLLSAALVTCLASLLSGVSMGSELRLLALDSPLFFFGSIMLTEPLTAPPTQTRRRIYGALVGALFIPQAHLGAIYSTPELALCLGNLYAYAVSPKRRWSFLLRKRSRLAPDVMEFIFHPQPGLTFAPGQYMEFTLGHAGVDSRGNRRYFTLASSPTENQVRLGVRFSARGSSYKQALARLDGRTPLLGGQLGGDFTLPADPGRKLVFIAGGIGITPFRSMLKYLADTGQRRDILLLYANRGAEDIVYQDVLGEAQARVGARVIYTLTDPARAPHGWRGALGRVDARFIAAVAPDYRERWFYLSGPPHMVRETAAALRALGVPRRQIKRDYFAGLV
jgi:glycine betaine catabolism B